MFLVEQVTDDDLCLDLVTDALFLYFAEVKGEEEELKIAVMVILILCAFEIQKKSRTHLLRFNLCLKMMRKERVKRFGY